jgi:hypothetical protein
LHAHIAVELEGAELTIDLDAICRELDAVFVRCPRRVGSMQPGANRGCSQERAE